MNDKELNNLIKRSEQEYEMLKDRVHYQFEEIKELKHNFDEVYKRCEKLMNIINKLKENDEIKDWINNALSEINE